MEGESHLRSARVEGDAIEQRLNLVLWNSWGRTDPGMPRIIQLPGGLTVQDHTRGHLLDDDRFPPRFSISQLSPLAGISR